MATPRKLGGGRILGTGKSLAPPTPVYQQRSSSLLPQHARSESAQSSSSRGSTGLIEGGSGRNAGSVSPLLSPLPSPLAALVMEQDLSSRVSLENSGASSVASASMRLLCPICNEEMMTLLQLNRHLDDNHQELPPVEQDEVKTWFNKQVVKAKKFQPLAVINQKLKGLDVFESNEGPTMVNINPAQVAVNRTTTPERQPDPDEVVTRTHWQRSGYNDMCTDPTCGKRLGPVNGSINCRKCGRLFCEEHTMYQMKLSRSAQHEPVRGYWCRVCETCFKSREGYNDHNGYIKDHTSNFFALRRKRVDKMYLEISRLEKRLTKLTQLLANPPEDMQVNNNSLIPLTGQRNQRKLLEQSVVTWEDDAKVQKCPFCVQEFGSWSFRRHHCRLCGRVVCADPSTGCSSEIGLNVAGKSDALSEKSTGDLSLDVRMCKECKTTVFSKRDFAQQLLHRPPDQRAYENLVQFEKGIRVLLPNFQRLLAALQDPDKPPSQNSIAEAAKVRKRLNDSFVKYDLSAKRIRDMPTASPTQKKLQNHVYQQASSFLHIYMLPLKQLPKILKHASPHGIQRRNNPQIPLPHNGRGALAAIKFNDMETASQSSSAISALEGEEKELRERLIVLEEQKFFVSEMVADANRRRKFDEVTSLTGNVQDLTHEIDTINGMLSQLDFAGAYARDQEALGNR